jgi:hypothetical protein
MNIPGFTAETSLPYSSMSYRINKTFELNVYHGINLRSYSEPMIVAAAGSKKDVPPLIVSDLTFCEFRNVCRSVPVLGPCGSAPEGGTPPMCPTGETETQCWKETVCPE